MRNSTMNEYEESQHLRGADIETALSRYEYHSPDDGENFRHPNDCHNKEREKLIAVVAFNQKEHHSHHDWEKYHVLKQMRRNQLLQRKIPIYKDGKLMGEVQHMLLRFSKRKAYQRSCREEQEARLYNHCKFLGYHSKDVPELSIYTTTMNCLLFTT